MLFIIKGHLNKIVLGLKTETSRGSRQTKTGKEWWRMIPGKVYRATKDYYTPRSEAIIIRCTHRWLEKISHISEKSARNEGGYTVEEFKKLWLEKFGSIDKLVQRYRFEFVRDNRPFEEKIKSLDIGLKEKTILIFLQWSIMSVLDEITPWYDMINWDTMKLIKKPKEAK